PRDRFESRRHAAAVDVDLPPLSPLAPEGRGAGGEGFPDAARVDVNDGGAAAELARDRGDQFGSLHRSGVDADLFGAGLDEARRVVEGADAAADGERHEQLFRDAADHVEQDRAALVAGADVEENELVGAVLLVAARDLDGVAGVAQLQEVDALNDAAAIYVETGDDSFGQHRPAEVRFASANASTLRGRAVAVNGAHAVESRSFVRIAGLQ